MVDSPPGLMALSRPTALGPLFHCRQLALQAVAAWKLMLRVPTELAAFQALQLMSHYHVPECEMSCLQTINELTGVVIIF